MTPEQASKELNRICDIQFDSIGREAAIKASLYQLSECLSSIKGNILFSDLGNHIPDDSLASIEFLCAIQHLEFAFLSMRKAWNHI